MEDWMPEGTPRSMGQWEVDLDRLLGRWPLTGRFDELADEIDVVLQRSNSSGSPPRLALCLSAVARFLFENRDDPFVRGHVITDSAGKFVTTTLSQALFRFVSLTPDSRLDEPINLRAIVILMDVG